MTILAYHSVSVRDHPLAIAPDDFARQLDALAKAEHVGGFQMKFPFKTSHYVADFGIEWAPEDQANKERIFKQLENRARDAVIKFAREQEKFDMGNLLTHVTILLNRQDVTATLGIQQVWFFIRGYSMDGVPQPIHGIIIGTGRIENTLP